MGFEPYAIDEWSEAWFPLKKINGLSEASEFGALYVERGKDSITTLSNAIERSGGLTSYSDVSNLEITRDIPFGRGGGKKKAIINSLINPRTF